MAPNLDNDDDGNGINNHNNDLNNNINDDNVNTTHRTVAQNHVTHNVADNDDDDEDDNNNDDNNSDGGGNSNGNSGQRTVKKEKSLTTSSSKNTHPRTSNKQDHFSSSSSSPDDSSVPSTEGGAPTREKTSAPSTPNSISRGYSSSKSPGKSPAKSPRHLLSSSKSPRNSTPRSSKSSVSRKSRRSTKRKAITFKKTVGVHTIPNIDTYSISEKDATWYAPDDYGIMEDECDLTADLLDKRIPLSSIHCARGLEAWTTEGEQRKEANVQLAIDIVWQAQLDQWKASTDASECWEFIRSRYIAISKPCHRIAQRRGLLDEKEIQSYLAGVRNVEKNRQRLLGIHNKSAAPKERKIRRENSGGGGTSGAGAGRNNHKSFSASASPAPPGRKGILKVVASDIVLHTTSIGETDDSQRTSTSKPKKFNSTGSVISSTSKRSNTSSSKSKQRQGGKESKLSSDNAASSSSSSSAAAAAANSGDLSSPNAGRKISYEPKSRSKVPVSPVASLVTDADSDENSTSRRLRSHMSVSSDDSTRRRMLRSASLKPL